MGTLGVLSLLPSCPGWWLLIGCSASDVTATAAVCVLCGRGDRCCCESLGGVAWFPTHPMSFEECRAACCYLGDRSTPPMICTTRILSRLHGSLEEDVIKNLAFITCRSKVSRSSAGSYYQSDEGVESPRWENPARCPRNDPPRPLTRTKEPRGFNPCRFYRNLCSFLSINQTELCTFVCGQYRRVPGGTLCRLNRERWSGGEHVTLLWAFPHQSIRHHRGVVVIRRHVSTRHFDGITGWASLFQRDVHREGPSCLEISRLSDKTKETHSFQKWRREGQLLISKHFMRKN